MCEQVFANHSHYSRTLIARKASDYMQLNCKLFSFDTMLKSSECTLKDPGVIKLRILAVAIDSLLMTPFSISLVLLWSLALRPEIQVTCSISLCFCILAYRIVCHKCWGQTFGKRMMGIYVASDIYADTQATTKRDQHLSWPQSLMRELVPILGYCWSSYLLVMLVFSTSQLEFAQYAAADRLLNMLILTWWLLALISIFCNSQQRAPHDFMANTVVISLNHSHARDINVNKYNRTSSTFSGFLT